VAHEWLSLNFRSGFNEEYMNKLINNNKTNLTNITQQIEALAQKFGTSNTLCESHLFGWIVDPKLGQDRCNYIDYNYNEVMDIININMHKANAIYRNIINLIGPVSNEKSEIGAINIDLDILLPTQEQIEDKSPIITLNGESKITIEVGDSYTDEGATTTDGSILNIKGVDDIDTSIARTYHITYSAVDDEGNKAKDVYRTVIVKENLIEIPIILSKGSTPNPISSLTSMSVFCNFESDLPIGYKVKFAVNHSLDDYFVLKAEGGLKDWSDNYTSPKEEGTYTIYYKLYDEDSEFVKDLGSSEFVVKIEDETSQISLQNSTIKRTGQNIIYTNFDDGYYKAGIPINYARVKTINPTFITPLNLN